MANKMRKGDTVVVLTGKDRGKRGEVLRVKPQENRVVVQGVNVVKRHRRQSMQSQGGIEEVEAPVHISNVAVSDPRDGKPTRVGFQVLADGRKVRYAKRSQETIDR